MKPNQQARFIATKRLTIISASTNTLLAIIKIIVGHLGHSQTLIADGLHSFSDLINDALVLIATRMGGSLPDKEHPYGHQRIETIATILLAFLMLFVGGCIFYGNLYHLINNTHLLTHSLPVMLTAILSIFAYEGLYRYNRKIGKRINSNLLISNAYHNRSDAYTSTIVLLTGIGAWFHIPYLDALGAIIIALLIIKMGIGIFWRGVQELIDAGADDNTLQKIIACIQLIPGVVSVHQLRTRMHSGTILVDVHIIVDPFISVSEGHYIGEQIPRQLMQAFPKITDVIVHVDPEDDEKQVPSICLPSRTELLVLLNSHWKNLPGYQQIKKITIHYLDGQIYLDIVLPLNIIPYDNYAELTQQYQHAITKIPEVAQINLAFTTGNKAND